MAVARAMTQSSGDSCHHCLLADILLRKQAGTLHPTFLLRDCRVTAPQLPLPQFLGTDSPASGSGFVLSQSS